MGQHSGNPPQKYLMCFHNSVSDTKWFNIAAIDLYLCLCGVLGVELLLQPDCAVHQPAQSAARGNWPGKEKESPWQVRNEGVLIMHILTQVNYFSNYLCFDFLPIPCRYGDMRVMMAYELFSMWQKLGMLDPHHHHHTHMHIYITVKCLHFCEMNSLTLICLNLCNQVTTSPTSSQEWWAPSLVSHWCRKLRFEISWSQSSMTWWIGSRGKMAISNRWLWSHENLKTVIFQMDKHGQQITMAECAYVFVCVGGSRADG